MTASDCVTRVTDDCGPSLRPWVADCEEGFKNGNYILDSLGRAAHWLRRQADAYLFGPIKICIACTLVLLTFIGTSAASMPAAFSAEIRASAGANRDALHAVSKCISTFLALTDPATGLFDDPRWTTCIPTACTPQDNWAQPAAASASSSLQTKSACSPSPPPMPTSNSVLGNGLRRSTIDSLLDSTCSCLRILSFASSSCASAAIRFASAARSLASPASFTASERLSFERFRNSVCIRLFHMLNMTSPTMPTATPASGTSESVKNRSYGGLIMATINSAMMQTMTSAPHHLLHRSQDSDAPSNPFVLAFFVPFGRYHSGNNSCRVFFVAVMTWSIMLAFILGAIYVWG